MDMSHILGSLGAQIVTKTYPETKEKLALQQREFLLSCIRGNLGSGLCESLGLNKALLREWELLSYELFIKNIIGLLGINYYKDILPFVEQEALTLEKPLYIGRTSGTSDGNNGGKDIPITDTSLQIGEFDAISNTLGYVLEHSGVGVLLGKALFLTGSFDGSRGYISGITGHAAGWRAKLFSYPPKPILELKDWEVKKASVLQDLQEKKVSIKSAHGVPVRPLELMHYLIDQDRALAKEVFANFQYVSIGGGPPLDYKMRYKRLLESVGIDKPLYATNNHNATEGFFGSQLRNFDDLEFHWMRPHIWGNWFGYVELDKFQVTSYKLQATHDGMSDYHIIGLHEVVPGVEYVQITINHRIPVPYVVKDVVVFNEEGEYLVTGRIGMASNVANEHIEQKHILACLEYLHSEYPDLSDYFAIAGMELTSDSKLIFHWLVEHKLPVTSYQLPTISEIEEKIDQWFRTNHEQYTGFATRGLITCCKVRLVQEGGLIEHLKSLGRRHEQSKIPHIGDKNYPDIIALRKV